MEEPARRKERDGRRETEGQRGGWNGMGWREGRDGNRRVVGGRRKIRRRTGENSSDKTKKRSKGNMRGKWKTGKKERRRQKNKKKRRNGKDKCLNYSPLDRSSEQFLELGTDGGTETTMSKNVRTKPISE